MDKPAKDIFGNSFERIFVASISVITGIILIYLAIIGPLFLDQIHYKTADVINNQLAGQDLVNMFILSPVLITGGVGLFLRKQFSRYLINLGFSIPLGLISVYLLWVRPDTTFPIQFMFYGFFFTMIIAVNAMGFIMFLNNDPTFLRNSGNHYCWGIFLCSQEL